MHLCAENLDYTEEYVPALGPLFLSGQHFPFSPHGSPPWPLFKWHLLSEAHSKHTVLYNKICSHPKPSPPTVYYP